MGGFFAPTAFNKVKEESMGIVYTFDECPDEESPEIIAFRFADTAMNCYKAIRCEQRRRRREESRIYISELPYIPDEKFLRREKRERQENESICPILWQRAIRLIGESAKQQDGNDRYTMVSEALSRSSFGAELSDKAKVRWLTKAKTILEKTKKNGYSLIWIQVKELDKLEQFFEEIIALAFELFQRRDTISIVGGGW